MLMFLVCLGIYCPTREFFSHLETSPLPVLGQQNLTYARHSWLLSSEGSLACHTYCDTGTLFIMVISEDPWHLHLLPSDSNTKPTAWPAAKILMTLTRHFRVIYQKWKYICYINGYSKRTPCLYCSDNYSSSNLSAIFIQREKSRERQRGNTDLVL